MSAADVESVLNIQNVVAEVAHRIDAKQWSGLRQLYADSVQTDYRSLFGGEIQTQTADALMEAWRGVLSPIVTQHLLGPAVVSLQGERAIADCHVRGYHYREGLPGGSEWMVAGHYEFQLRRDGGRWLIDVMTLNLSYQTGNALLLSEAQAQPSS